MGENLLTQAFRNARLGAPTVLMLDDVDTLFDRRVSHHQSAQNASLIATLLMELDGLQLATGKNPCLGMSHGQK